jgi:hypothetical protein
VNDTLDGSSNAIKIERAAHNEAGHALVGRFQGRAITSIRVGDKQWETWDDHLNMVNIRSDVEPHFPYQKLGCQSPHKGWCPTLEDECTFKCAGPVAEELFCEQIGVDSSEIGKGEMDMLQAEALARRRYPDDPQKQEEMLHNSKSLARKILSEPSCWRAVKNLAQAVADVLVKEPVLNGDQVHEIISQTLAQEEDDTPENHID